MERYQTIIKTIIFLLLLIAAASLYHYRDLLTEENIRAFIDSQGFLAPLIFIAIYSIAPVVFFPNVILTLIGGALFGLFYGSIYVLIGCTIGSTLAFLTGRYLAQKWVEENAQGQIGKIKEGIDKHGWKFVAFTRLFPFFPFTILNFVFGLTKIPALSYAITSFIFMSPLVIFYVYLGKKAMELSLQHLN
ncbi:MAG: TVP38/TMEM64 family protein [Candidatus Caenarcaniphilales bacterium]|nr:TVP38/TMEM64 family protein [Candidatus Caenarcaniphilales bacterium]